MMISMIAAVADHRVIGKDNDLIWHLPADLQFFKSTTKGHHIIMGRKTFESLNKPLPYRTNIIVTRQANYQVEGAIVVGSLDQAIQSVQNDEEPFIVGGAEIYRQGMEIADRIYITRVHGEFDGDTHFPEIPESEWTVVKKEFRPKDERNAYDMTFYTYERKAQSV
jgi:dihydrofolate reductase